MNFFDYAQLFLPAGDDASSSSPTIKRRHKTTQSNNNRNNSLVKLAVISTGILLTCTSCAVGYNNNDYGVNDDLRSTGKAARRLPKVLYDAVVNTAEQPNNREGRGLPAYFLDNNNDDVMHDEDSTKSTFRKNEQSKVHISTLSIATTTTTPFPLAKAAVPVKSNSNNLISQQVKMDEDDEISRPSPLVAKATVVDEVDGEAGRPKCAQDHDLPYCFDDAWYPKYDCQAPPRYLFKVCWRKTPANDRELLSAYCSKVVLDHRQINEAIAHESADADSPLFSSINKTLLQKSPSADDLVDGINSADEQKLDYAFYYGKDVFKTSFSTSPSDGLEPKYPYYRYKADYYKQGGYTCPSYISYKPLFRALNTQGQWRLIANSVQDEEQGRNALHQPVRVETCMYPMARCSYVSEFYHSKCVQKFAYQRLITYDIVRRRLGTDIFRLPTSCSCFIDGVNKIVMPNDVSPISNVTVDPEADEVQSTKTVIQIFGEEKRQRPSNARRQSIINAKNRVASPRVKDDDEEVPQTTPAAGGGKVDLPASYSDFYARAENLPKKSSSVNPPSPSEDEQDLTSERTSSNVPSKTWGMQALRSLMANRQIASRKPSTARRRAKPGSFNPAISPALGTFLAQLREHPLETLTSEASVPVEQVQLPPPASAPPTSTFPTNEVSLEITTNNKNNKTDEGETSPQFEAAASSPFSERILDPDSVVETPHRRLRRPAPAVPKSSTTVIEVDDNQRPRVGAAKRGALAALDYPNFDMDGPPEKPFSSVQSEAKDTGVSTYYDYNAHRHKMLVNPEKLDKAIDTAAGEALQKDLASLTLDSASASASPTALLHPPLVAQQRPFSAPPPESSGISDAVQLLSMPSLSSLAYQPLSEFSRLANPSYGASSYVPKTTSTWLMRDARRTDKKSNDDDENPLKAQLKFQRLTVLTGRSNDNNNSTTRARRSITLEIVPPPISTKTDLSTFHEKITVPVQTESTTILVKHQEHGSSNSPTRRDFSSSRLSIKPSNHRRKMALLHSNLDLSALKKLSYVIHNSSMANHDSADQIKYGKLAELIEWE